MGLIVRLEGDFRGFGRVLGHDVYIVDLSTAMAYQDDHRRLLLLLLLLHRVGVWFRGPVW
jgi:hypothetical protein